MVSKRVNMPRNADPGLVVELEPVLGVCEGRAAGPVASPATAGDQPLAIEHGVHGADRPAGPPPRCPGTSR
jgi:hypothetical protein